MLCIHYFLSQQNITLIILDLAANFAVSSWVFHLKQFAMFEFNFAAAICDKNCLVSLPNKKRRWKGVFKRLVSQFFGATTLSNSHYILQETFVRRKVTWKNLHFSSLWIIFLSNQSSSCHCFSSLLSLEPCQKNSISDFIWMGQEFSMQQLPWAFLLVASSLILILSLSALAKVLVRLLAQYSVDQQTSLKSMYFALFQISKSDRKVS